jgi:hypothetical protein
LRGSFLIGPVRIRFFDTAALVNEAYLRLMGAGRSSWQDRTHFFSVCAQIMPSYARAQVPCTIDCVQ